MPHLTARARSGLSDSPALASCVFEGRLAFIGFGFRRVQKVFA